jgi:hypothetical protein
MAKRYSINQPKVADRRTALLGLAVAGRDADTTPCLSDEEMAALVDGVCSREERARYFQHLAYCETCYQHWVELSEVVASEENKRNRDKGHTLFRPQYFAWAGSLLAAAASVVLFLNITREPPPTVVHRPMKTMVERKNLPASELQEETKSVGSMPMPAGKAVDALEDKTDYGVSSRRGSPLSAPAMKMEDHVTEEYSQAQSIAGKKKMEAVEKNAAANLDRSGSTILKQSRSPIRLWLDIVRLGCQRHETSQQFWTKQYMTGEQFTVFHTPEEKQLIKDLLPLVGKLQRETSESRSVCERILKHFEDASVE